MEIRKLSFQERFNCVGNDFTGRWKDGFCEEMTSLEYLLSYFIQLEQWVVKLFLFLPTGMMLSFVSHTVLECLNTSSFKNLSIDSWATFIFLQPNGKRCSIYIEKTNITSGWWLLGKLNTMLSQLLVTGTSACHVMEHIWQFHEK